MRKRNKNLLILTVVILSIILWSVLFLFISPKEIIDKIGVENSYILILLMAVFSGVSTLTSTSHYATVFTFAAGGLNIFLISLLAGIGMTIGDTIFYYLGKKGSQSLPEKIKGRLSKIEEWLAGKSKAFVPVSIYLYTGFTPLPGDILSVFLGVTNHKYKVIILPILLGNISLMIWISLLAKSGIDIF